MNDFMKKEVAEWRDAAANRPTVFCRLCSNADNVPIARAFDLFQQLGQLIEKFNERIAKLEHRIAKLEECQIPMFHSHNNILSDWESKGDFGTCGSECTGCVKREEMNIEVIPGNGRLKRGDNR